MSKVSALVTYTGRPFAGGPAADPKGSGTLIATYKENRPARIPILPARRGPGMVGGGTFILRNYCEVDDSKQSIHVLGHVPTASSRPLYIHCQTDFWRGSSLSPCFFE